MEDTIRQSPGQFVAGLRAAEQVALPAGRFSHILLAGLGGSWMAGALVREAQLTSVPITIHRSYDLPRALPSGTLVIASSFSGNTEETLSAYAAARSAGLPLLGIAAGGELEKRCTQDGIPFLKIPADPPTMQPRSATGYGVGILAQVLARLGCATPDAVSAVGTLGASLQQAMEPARARAETLVPPLVQATPIIYASDRFETVARIWKIKINENAKTAAFSNVFPELNHNEMIGWSKIPRSRLPAEALAKAGGEGRSQPHGAFHIILLRDPADHPRIQKRFDITLALLQEKGISSSIVPITGASLPEKIFSTLLLGDWMSTLLALALGINPSPVPMVEDLKRRLKE
ncbi:MAG: glucose/mannose-6-phosphate isomerase [Parcubacteria group bacterium Gr01-1014_106]|nr:MAG: glucose/mannose-6-phosphate isomerase [Parcubacteria group bacterium Gr01-1014_106]